MSSNVVTNVIREVLQRLYGCEPNEISPTALLREELGLDSLSLVELIVTLEETLQCTFDDVIIAQSPLLTVADLCRIAQESNEIHEV